MSSTDDETAEQHHNAKKPRTQKGAGGLPLPRQSRSLCFRLIFAVYPADESRLPLPLNKPTYEKLPLSLGHANPALAPFLLAEGLSSMETLLTNIQVITEVNRWW